MKEKRLFNISVAILGIDLCLVAIFLGRGMAGTYSIGKTILLVAMMLVSMACGLMEAIGCYRQMNKGK